VLFIKKTGILPMDYEELPQGPRLFGVLQKREKRNGCADRFAFGLAMEIPSHARGFVPGQHRTSQRAGLYQCFPQYGGGGDMEPAVVPGI